MTETLMLNRSYIPIKLTSSLNAICKLYCGRAEVIVIKDGQYESYNWNQWVSKSMSEPDNSRFVHAATFRVALPTVVRYTEYDRIPRVRMRPSRKNILKRDGYKCYICGEVFPDSQLSIDHIIPLSRGGKSDWRNLITCCKECNALKDDRLLSELKWKPKFMPFEPPESNMVRLRNSIRVVKEEWKYFGINWSG
jgi:5-methylcytosine-specific restriction endonuclease McrA